LQDRRARILRAHAAGAADLARRVSPPGDRLRRLSKDTIAAHLALGFAEIERVVGFHDLLRRA
jgi:hypothetical protein